MLFGCGPVLASATPVLRPPRAIPPAPRLLDRVRALLRTRHYSRRIEKAYDAWIRRYIVFHGKRHPDVTVRPDGVADRLRHHLRCVRAVHEADLRAGRGRVALPDALERKYPGASAEWPWQWVFPASRHYVDAHGGQHRRHHVHESVLQRAFQKAVSDVGITKPATAPTLRHSFAAHLLERGYDIRTRSCSATAT